MYKMCLTSITVLLLAFSVSAQHTWELDHAHSNINFTIAHLVISNITGKFNDFSCTLKTKGDDFTGTQVDVTIKAASINTNNEKRDDHLRSVEFFDVQKYPEITFKSTSFEKSDNNSYKITGNLTMHGVTKTVVLDTQYKGQIKDPYGNIKIGFRVSTSLDRYDYDLKYNTALEGGGLLIGKELAIEINLELVKK